MFIAPQNAHSLILAMFACDILKKYSLFLPTTWFIATIGFFLCLVVEINVRKYYAQLTEII
jgi:hypothetical protein